MAEKLTQLTCEEFVTVLATKEPVPGGGGTAALVGALGVALGNMVGSLTVGKKKYAEVESEILALKAKADALQEQLLALVDKDAEAFAPLAAAYGLPAGEEKVLVEGTDGLNHYTAQITYENGQEVQRTILTQQLVRAAQDEVILRGVDRSVMDQTFTHTDDYIIPNSQYTYTPPEATAASAAVEHKTVPGTTLTYHSAVRFTGTAYTCNSPNYLGNGKTYTGTDARVGVVAVDPEIIPLGTRMYIASADGEYIYGYCVAEDTGSLISGTIVDLYYDTHEACMDFGRRDVIIYFLD